MVYLQCTISNKDNLKDNNSNTLPKPTKNQHNVSIKVYIREESMYTDQTGHFLHVSSKGNQYLIVVVNVGSTLIDCKLIQDWISNEMIWAYLALWKRLAASSVIKPSKQILDNEANS